MNLKITLLLFLALTGITQALTAQQTINASLSNNGVNRQYIVYVPATYDSAQETPLLFNFHGFTQQAQQHMNTSAMREVADTAGFILVYPQGSGFFGIPHWNVGAWTNGSTADDIGFTHAMIDTLAADYNIDLNRVYSCGYSNGGYFSYELACQMSDRIAAVGSVGGKMSSETFNACDPAYPTPLVTIHGTADNTVSYTTNAPSNSKTLAETHEYWIMHNGLDLTPTVTSLPDTDPTDGSTVELYAYRDNCTAVDHYKVEGGGHDWVGVRGNMDIDASSIIWNFVSQYDLNGLIECSDVSSFSTPAFAKTLHAYPNPTRGLVTIDIGLTEPISCEVYSMTGQLMVSNQVGPNKKSFDISSLTKGVYILAIGGNKARLIKE